MAERAPVRLLPLPRGWGWHLDRTGDIVSVQIGTASGRVVADAVVVATPRVWIRLAVLVVEALYTEYLENPTCTWFWNRHQQWRSRRVAARARHEEGRLTFAERLDGRYDCRGMRVAEQAQEGSG